MQSTLGIVNSRLRPIAMLSTGGAQRGCDDYDFKAVGILLACHLHARHTLLWGARRAMFASASSRESRIHESVRLINA